MPFFMQFVIYFAMNVYTTTTKVLIESKEGYYITTIR